MFHTKKEGDQCGAVRRILNRLALFVLPLFVLVAAMPVGATAEETARKDGWQFNANVYLWGASMGGKTANGDDLDVSFTDLLKNLKVGMMGGVGARNGRWSLMTDVMYMDLKHEDSKQVTVPVGPGVNIGADATAKVQSWLVTPAVGYAIFDTDRVRFEVLAGARYLFLKSELDLQVTGPLQPRNKTLSASGSGVDGIGGIRGNVNLDKNWYVPFYVDMGAGKSPFTWQGFGGVGYRVSRVVDVVAAYRYLYWKFKANPVLDKLDFSGPLVGVRFQF